TWDRWKHVIIALNLIDTLAMREANTNKPKGGKFNLVVGKFLRDYGFDRIHKSDRSRMRKYAGKLEVIDAWRAEQPTERQLELNYPRVVYNQWRRSLAPSPPAGSKRGGKPEPVDKIMYAVFTAMSEADWAEVLPLFLDFEVFLRVMPPSWRSRLEAR